jgi:Peptidase propeptide and YPEB domain
VKLYCDHRQMQTDTLLVNCISSLVALYLDCTAVSQEIPILRMDVQSVSMQIQCIMTCCRLFISAAICTAIVGGSGVVSGYTGEELAKNAKITLSEARVIALKAFPGKITDEELEKEKGGSGLRYSFDIKNAGVTHEVGVDAKTGKLLENSAEGPHAD